MLSLIDVGAVIVAVDPVLETFDSVRELAQSCIHRQESPRWIVRTAAGFLIPGREHSSPSSKLFAHLAAGLQPFRREYLDADFIKSRGHGSAAALEAIEEEFDATHIAIDGLLRKLRSQIEAGKGPTIASTLHRLRGLAGQYGDLRCRKMMDRCIADIKELGRTLSSTDVKSLVASMEHSFTRLNLYRGALEMELAEPKNIPSKAYYYPPKDMRSEA